MSLRNLSLIAALALAFGGVLVALRRDPPRAYWPSGMRRHEGHGAPGRERGTWSYWYPDGQLREQGEYRRGRRVGTWRQWFPSGHRASLGKRVWDEASGASVRHGPWTFWHDNGALKARGTYELGRREGEWSYWRRSGDEVVLDEELSGRYEDDRKVE